MRKACHIFAVLLLFILVACEQQIEQPPVEIEIPENGYIFFNTKGEIKTKGELIEGHLYDHFAVIGYSYPFRDDWNTVRVMAKPNVLTDDPGNFVSAKKITWNGEVHYYSPLASWKSSQKYSFFAYYPYSDTNPSPSGVNYEGEPYIDYTLCSRTEPTDLKDVMTSYVLNTYVTETQNKNVDFKMEHRLAAIDVIASNFNDNVGGTPVYVKISEMKVSLDNLLFDKVRIPLNTKESSALGTKTKAGNVTAEYPIITGSDFILSSPCLQDLDRDGETDGDTPLTYGLDSDENEINKSLIVIPQKVAEVEELIGDGERLTATVTFKYSYVDEHGNPIEFDKADGSGKEMVVDVYDSKTVSLEKDLGAGRRYYIQMSFSRSNVTIAIVETNTWSEKSITHTFE